MTDINEENAPKRKVTRKIRKFDFSDENATVSLVGPSVGGGANGYITLLTKSDKKVSEEFIKKASEVTVTLEITEYLRRFFGLWYEDAEILARALGFTTKEMDDAQKEEPRDYNKYLEDKVSSIKVMKSLYESENIEKSLIELSEEDYLKVLQDQEIVEKAFVEIDKGIYKTSEIDKACSGKGRKPVKKNSSAIAGDTSTNVDVENGGDVSPVVKNKNKENSMTEKVETVEKAQFDAIQKQLEDQKVELQKALDLVNKYETEKKEAIAKSRKEQLDKACGKYAEVIFKACGEVEDGLFAEVVKSLSEMQEQVEKSAMFQEMGASVDPEDKVQESSLAKVIKAKYQQKQQ